MSTGVVRSATSRIVVVGNGIAGQTACDTLRAHGFDGDLTIVGDEAHAAYSRPALSKALLVDGGSHELAEPTHGATEIRGVAARGLDTEARTVSLDDGTTLPYDGLVIASGSRARRLGAVESGEFTLRTLDDALTLRERLSSRPSVTVLGAGVLGMEVASAALSAGCEVTVVADARPMSAHLGTYLSEAITSSAIAQGLKLVEGCATEVVQGRTVLLADGTRIDSDLVVTAIGDIANIEWLAGTGLVREGALRTDSRGRVAPCVVAAGDVATIPTPTGMRRIPLWSSAIDQSKVAAQSLLDGEDAPDLEHRPYFWTEQFGVNLKAIGALPVTGEPEFLVGEQPTGPSVMRWASNDGREASGTAVAINHRVPIPKLRRMALGSR